MCVFVTAVPNTKLGLNRDGFTVVCVYYCRT
jgi:hypothetical protein